MLTYAIWFDITISTSTLILYEWHNSTLNIDGYFNMK